MKVFAAVTLIVRAVPPTYMNVGVRPGTFYLGLARAFYGFTLGVVLHRHVRLARVSSWLMLVPFAVLSALLLWPDTLTMQPARDLITVFILCPVLVLAGMRWEASSSLILACAFVGDLSYPLYIVHRPLTQLVVTIADAANVPTWFGAFVFLFVSIMVAWSLARWFDAPVRDRLSRWMKLRESAPPQIN